ncbi:hypothetical protein G7L32_26930, partial [Klebsiella quasipneumoniae]|nr:hypothetical protein [Klebsiella quasipneumoniae]
AFADRIARRRGQEGRYQLANGMARCWTPTTRWAAMSGLRRPHRPPPRSGGTLSAGERYGAMLDADDALG